MRKNTMTSIQTAGAFLALALGGAAAANPVLPANEDFNAGAANWFDAAGATTLDAVASGSFDGSGFVTATTTVPDPVPPFGSILFRAQDEYGSSGGVFEGDWSAAGVDAVSFWVRHDAAAPLTFFARMAGPLNFPGASSIGFVPVLPNVWTQVTLDVAESSPSLFLEGDTYANVFSNIGHLQIGVQPTDALIGTTFNVDLDQVVVTPAPGALAVLALLGCRRRRRR
jgi:hypothetical protein